MSTDDSFEKEQAAREARDSVAGRPRTGRRDALASALMRYLGAQSYRDRDRPTSEDESPKDQA